MQIRDRFPDDAVTGACLITGSSSTAEPIVDLDLDVDTLPAWGRICISAKGVRLLCTALDWNVDPTIDDQLTQLRAERDELEEENRDLRDKIRAVAEALRLSELIAAAEPERLVAG